MKRCWPPPSTPLTHVKIVGHKSLYFFALITLVIKMEEKKVRVWYKTVVVVECPYCGYTWTPWVPRPKECGRCRRRLPWGEE